MNKKKGILKSKNNKKKVVDREKKKFCNECNTEDYIRSHHCPICDICILRKDHHCFFLGGCVGISNHRYFFLTCFWLAIGSGYALSYYYALYDKIFPPFNEWKWMNILSPLAFIISCIFDEKQHVSNSLMIIAFCLHIFALFIGTIFGSIHFYYIFKGKTSYDNYLILRKKINIKPDGETVMKRLRFTFGNHWYINILLPNYWENIIIEKNMINNIFYPSSLND